MSNENSFVLPTRESVNDKKENGEWFNVPGIGGGDGIGLKIRFTPAAKFTSISKEFKIKYTNKKTGQIDFYTDDQKNVEASISLIKGCVTDWRNVVDNNGESVPFSDKVFSDFIDIMATIKTREIDEDGEYLSLANFIQRITTDPDRFFGEKKI